MYNEWTKDDIKLFKIFGIIFIVVIVFYSIVNMIKTDAFSKEYGGDKAKMYTIILEERYNITLEADIVKFKIPFNDGPSVMYLLDKIPYNILDIRNVGNEREIILIKKKGE